MESERSDGKRSAGHKFVARADGKRFHRPGCTYTEHISANDLVTFTQDGEPASLGLKPCGHCLPTLYGTWSKDNSNAEFGGRDGEYTSAQVTAKTHFSNMESIQEGDGSFRDRWLSIKQRMEKAAVVHLLGEPHYRSQAPRTWYYRVMEASRMRVWRVVFCAGRVVRVDPSKASVSKSQAGPFRILPSHTRGRKNQAVFGPKWQDVKVGMRRSDILRILGKPHFSHCTGDKEHLYYNVARGPKEEFWDVRLCKGEVVAANPAPGYFGVLQSEAILKPQPIPTLGRLGDSSGDHFVDFVASELMRDIEYLADLGIKLDEGTLAAKTGGAAWAGYEAFTGDWLSALVVGGLSLLAGTITGGYKRMKLAETRQKWIRGLGSMNRAQLEYLAAGLSEKYPVLLYGLQHLLAAGE
jgi:outer membrane protein assembly factor BamE (lipoprotein component of BamABCDE complex)